MVRFFCYVSFFLMEKFWVSKPPCINTSIRSDFNWTLFIPKNRLIPKSTTTHFSKAFKGFSKASQVLEKGKYLWLSYGQKYIWSFLGQNYFLPSLGELFLALPWLKILMGLPWPKIFKAHPWSKVLMALPWPKIFMVLQWPKILDNDKLGWQTENY